jgi:hypothetical protein
VIIWYNCCGGGDSLEEVWKDIIGYEGLYQISNIGRVKSFRQWKRAGKCPEYILKPSLSNNGYYQVMLYRNHSDRHKYLIHRLVAEAFIANPNNFESVNHKDENVLNNSADNLEWCTLSYNVTYGTARIRQSITKGNRVQQLTLEGVLLATYESSYIASMITGIPKHAIKDCCYNKCQSGHGYIWRYAESSDQK